MAATATTEIVSIQLPADLYTDVCQFLSLSGEVDSSAVDRFIEAAVSNYLIRKSTQELHAATAHIPEEDLAIWIQESIDSARAER